ncbi:hypothetical protein ERO13_A09G200450v2 [Gossypium hirsutum]|uniref:Uncharacterized protein n=2 Tax=Gossypium TaxID=3633 RepID=A0A5D2P6Y2_GOSTO|nr:hypothetical protein ERO13_A09G200450v2 [Gossypium hirsutum]TYH03644.1 hypothetical protein ES288_A09G235700v1 [Gossypium darwinii]TYI11782.1 hypothetical protein ES332_A09G230800v1 [Gossypium tomentosum]
MPPEKQMLPWTTLENENFQISPIIINSQSLEDQSLLWWLIKEGMTTLACICTFGTTDKDGICVNLCTYPTSLGLIFKILDLVAMELTPMYIHYSKFQSCLLGPMISLKSLVPGYLFVLCLIQ